MCQRSRSMHTGRPRSHAPSLDNLKVCFWLLVLMSAGHAGEWIPQAQVGIVSGFVRVYTCIQSLYLGFFAGRLICKSHVEFHQRLCGLVVWRPSSVCNSERTKEIGDWGSIPSWAVYFYPFLVLSSLYSCSYFITRSFVSWTLENGREKNTAARPHNLYSSAFPLLMWFVGSTRSGHSNYAIYRPRGSFITYSPKNVCVSGDWRQYEKLWR